MEPRCLAGYPEKLRRDRHCVVGVSNRCFKCGAQCDPIAANPPYLLDDSQRAYRHGGGRLGEGLSVAIADLALERLAPGGTLLLYTGSAIVDGVDALAESLRCATG